MTASAAQVPGWRVVRLPKTVFRELEKEGIVVPEEARYFPYRATFNFECYCDKEKTQELKKHR